MLDFTFATPSEICRELGIRLRAARLQANLSRSTLAERVQLAPATLQQMEKLGKGSLENWVKVLAALGYIDAIQLLLVPRRPRSIAEMEAKDQPTRLRASRKPQSCS